MKLETYLKLSGIPYKIKSTANTRSAPKKKLPFIKDGDTVLGDSSLIIEYLVEKRGDRVDAHLSREEKATARAMKIMIEEHLSGPLAYSRWVDDDFWPVTRRDFFVKLPLPLKIFVPDLVRKAIVGKLKTMGWLAHSKEEIYSQGRQDIEAIADFLGEKKFLMGDKPSSVDATAYAFLANTLRPPIASPIKAAISGCPSLIMYIDRMEETVK